MKIVFSDRTTKGNVVFSIVAESDSEMALLSLLFEGTRWLEMESLSKTGYSAKISVSQRRKDDEQ